MKRSFHSASIQKRHGTQILPRAQNVPLLVKSQLVHPLLARLSSNIELSFNNSDESTHFCVERLPRVTKGPQTLVYVLRNTDKKQLLAVNSIS